MGATGAYLAGRICGGHYLDCLRAPGLAQLSRECSQLAAVSVMSTWGAESAGVAFVTLLSLQTYPARRTLLFTALLNEALISRLSPGGGEDIGSAVQDPLAIVGNQQNHRRWHCFN